MMRASLQAMNHVHVAKGDAEICLDGFFYRHKEKVKRDWEMDL